MRPALPTLLLPVSFSFLPTPLSFSLSAHGLVNSSLPTPPSAFLLPLETWPTLPPPVPIKTHPSSPQHPPGEWTGDAVGGDTQGHPLPVGPHHADEAEDCTGYILWIERCKTVGDKGGERGTEGGPCGENTTEQQSSCKVAKATQASAPNNFGTA